MTPPSLKPWPNVTYLSPCIAVIDGLPDAFMHLAAPGECAYVSAEALDAAMSRLRVAVEALEYARQHMATAAKDPVVAGGIHGRVFNALAAIGPLPELSPAPERAGEKDT